MKQAFFTVVTVLFILGCSDKSANTDANATDSTQKMASTPATAENFDIRIRSSSRTRIGSPAITNAL